MVVLCCAHGARAVHVILKLETDGNTTSSRSKTRTAARRNQTTHNPPCLLPHHHPPVLTVYPAHLRTIHTNIVRIISHFCDRSTHDNCADNRIAALPRTSSNLFHSSCHFLKQGRLSTLKPPSSLQETLTD